MVQADVDPSQGLQIVFRMTRNSFYSNDNMTTHPGIDVYLMNNSMEATRLATELGKPITLKDKKGVRIAPSPRCRLKLPKEFPHALSNCPVPRRCCGIRFACRLPVHPGLRFTAVSLLRIIHGDERRRLEESELVPVCQQHRLQHRAMVCRWPHNLDADDDALQLVLLIPAKKCQSFTDAFETAGPTESGIGEAIRTRHSQFEAVRRRR
uniref:Uncharacterized protein n=1 Tax=Panagrolaimus sp. JU765 TaxID=591449 RepID=A0AC34QPG5_9BILA